MFRDILVHVLCLPGMAQAPDRDGIFESYDDYAANVGRHVMQRDFISLIQRMGGRDVMEQF